MPEPTPSTAGASPPPWRQFLLHRFPDPSARASLRKALQRTFDREHDRPTRVFVVGPGGAGKSALVNLVARTCRATAVPASHVAFTHAYGQEAAHGPSGESLIASSPPTVLWACVPDTDAACPDGAEAIYVDLRSPVVERTPTFSQDVSTLDVLTWLGERPS